MKILHVTHVLPPFAHGGTETYVLGLARAQIAAGHQVSILAGRPARSRDDLPDAVEGVPVIWLPGTDDYFTRSATEAAVAGHGPEIVHVHHWHHVSDRIVRDARSHGAGVVASLHDFFATCPMFFRLRDGENPCLPGVTAETCADCVSEHVGTETHGDLIDAYRAAFRAELFAAHAVLAISDVQRDYLRRVPFLAGVDIRTLPLPAPPVPQVETPARRTPQNGVLRVVSWGGLVPGKGLRTLVEAAESLRRPEAVEITHYGRILDQEYRDALVRLARRTRLTFAGAYADVDIAGRFAAYDVAVFPSLFMETHGLVVDEALLVGLPVIVSDRGAPGLRVGRRGRVFPGGDSKALAAILEELIADPGELDRMRSEPAGPMMSLDFHLASMNGIYDHALAQVAAEKRAAAVRSKGMRILQVVHGYPPECRGGTETYLPRVVHELVRLGHHVEVLTGTHHGRDRVEIETFEHEGVRVHTLHRSGQYVDAWDRSFAPEIEPALDELIATVRPDLVHVQHWIRLSRHLVSFFHARGIPAMCTLHDLWSTCPIAFRVRDGEPCDRRAGVACAGCAPRGQEADEHEYLEGLELFRADLAQEVRLARRVIVPTAAHLAAILEHHPEIAESAAVVPFCTPQDPGGSRTRRPGRLPIRAAHWGNLSTLKGIDVLLGAVERLGPDVRAAFELHVFGDFVFPDEAARLAPIAASLGVRLHGRYEPKDVASVQPDLAIIPTRCSESHCYVLDEAFLLGIPAVVADRGALPERLAGAGATFEAGSAEDLARVLTGIARAPAVLDAWALRMPQLVSAAAHAASLARVYEEVLADPSPLATANPELVARRDRLRAHQIDLRTRRLDYLRGDLDNLRNDYARAKATMAEMDHYHREKDAVIAALRREIERLKPDDRSA